MTCRECWKRQKDAKDGKGAGVQPSAQAAESVAAPDDIPMDAGLASEPMPEEDAFAGMGATPVTPGEKPKFTGDWACAICGATIASLPFQPRSTENLKCIECFKQSK